MAQDIRFDIFEDERESDMLEQICHTYDTSRFVYRMEEKSKRRFQMGKNDKFNYKKQKPIWIALAYVNQIESMNIVRINRCAAL